MATLINLPTVDPPLAGRAPQRPLIDKGPGWIDAETVEDLGQQLAAGIITFPANIEQWVEETPDEVLADIFHRHLIASPLSSGFPLPHRTYALTRAFQQIADSHLTGLTVTGEVSPPSLQEVRWATEQLERHLFLVRPAVEKAFGLDVATEPEAYTAIEATVNVVLAATAYLDVEATSKLTGFTESTLGAWRANKVGPPYIKIANHRRSIRYPIAGLIDWLYSQVGS